MRGSLSGAGLSVVVGCAEVCQNKFEEHFFGEQEERASRKTTNSSEGFISEIAAATRSVYASGGGASGKWRQKQTRSASTHHTHGSTISQICDTKQHNGPASTLLQVRTLL